MPTRQPSCALSLQQQDPGEELQAGGVDTPARFDDERHEVRLVAVRLRLLAVVDRCCLARDCRARTYVPERTSTHVRSCVLILLEYHGR